MSAIPRKVKDRLTKSIKLFQGVLNKGREKDVNEADTVTIVTDMLSELFGYDKYDEITSEYCIRGTYCDLAIKVSGEIKLLIEVKAIGLDLKKNHLKQALDYAANEGIEWIALTNGVVWKIYKVIFAKPIDKELVIEFDFLQISPRAKENLESLFLLTREGRNKLALKKYHKQRQAMNRYTLAALIQSSPVITTIRRELKKLSPKTKFEPDDIAEILLKEVLKRDLVEGERALEEKKKIFKAIKKQTKQKDRKKERAISADHSNSFGDSHRRNQIIQNSDQSTLTNPTAKPENTVDFKE